MVRFNRLQVAALQTARPATSKVRASAESFNTALNKATNAKTTATSPTAKAAALRIARPAIPVSSGRSIPAATESTGEESTAQTAATFTSNLPASASPTSSATEAATILPAVPTMESVFGSHPYVENPTMALPDGTVASYNPMWFATRETAQKVADILGGTVVEKNAFTGDAGLVQQQQVNQMVQLPNGRLVNAGLVASYYDHGFNTTQLSEFMTAIKNEQG
jgi:hypothetical protein